MKIFKMVGFFHIQVMHYLYFPMRCLLLLALLFHFPFSIFHSVAQKMDPTFWWTGMPNQKLQIQFYQKGLANQPLSLTPYPGVILNKVEKVTNPNYLFAYLTISPQAQPGTLTFTSGKRKLSFVLNARDNKPKAQGYDSRDLVYLIMPDRFANGNPKNDVVKGMAEGMDRKADFGRHGGDIEGIVKHLDYFKSLGVTTLWLNPVQENDMPASSYHGYAITDYYAVDKRFGGMAANLDFMDKTHQRGMKVVMDMVMNHIGTNHIWVKDAPNQEFINNWPTYTPSNYRSTTVMDPYASQRDKRYMANGWFDRTMADVNQRNPLVADYLIQNCIWWIEHTGIDGIRMDTYPYPDRDFMKRWSEELIAAYPKLALVGEVWMGQPVMEAYFVKRKDGFGGFTGGLPTMTDFPLRDAIINGLNEGGGWDNGLSKIYNTLAQDFVYDTPERNLIFADNHDMSRVSTALKGSVEKTKQALVLLATLRGVPQVYYGAEIFMEGDGAYHPAIRKNFPGGWAGDSASVLENRNLSTRQTDMLTYFRKLFTYRKGSKALTEGKLMQFIPDDNVYVYSRTAGTSKALVIINGDDKTKELKLDRFEEAIGQAKSATEVLTGAKIDLSQGKISLPARAAYILEL